MRVPPRAFGLGMALVLVWACGPRPGPPGDLSLGDLGRAPRSLGVFLPAGGSLEATVELARGESARLLLDQRNLDLVATVAGPDGVALLEFDSPSEDWVEEPVCFVAATAGRHRVSVRPFAEGSGEVRVRFEGVRRAGPTDEACFEAARAQADQDTGLAGFARLAGLWRQAGLPLQAAIAEKEAARLEMRAGRAQAALAHLAAARAAAGEAPRLEAVLLGFEGQVSSRLASDQDGAERRFEAALAMADAAAFDGGRYLALLGLGDVALARGDVYGAMRRFRRALEVVAARASPGPIAEARLRLADTYQMVDRFEAADDLLADVLAVALRLRDTDLEARALVQQAWVLHRRGRSRDAIPLLERALALRRELGDRPGEAAVLDRLGSALVRSGDPAAAERRFREALAISAALANTREEAVHRLNLGCLAVRQGELEVATHELAAALRFFSGQSEPDSLAAALACGAELARARGALEAAAESLARAIEVVEAMRSSSRGQGHWHEAVGLWQDYHETLVGLLLEVHETTGSSSALERAFEVADQARSRRQTEMLIDDGQPWRVGADPELLRRERALRAEIEGTLAGEPAPREARFQVLEIEAQMREASPGFAMVSPPPLRFAAARRLLGPDSVLLALSLGRERSWLFVLPAGGELAVHGLPGRAELEEQAGATRGEIWQGRAAQLGRRAGQDEPRFAETLLGPAMPALAGAGKLVWVPDGGLSLLPFSALHLPGAEAGERVVDRFGVVSVPSLAALATLRSRAQARPGPEEAIAIFADPVFSAGDERLGGRSATAGSTPAGNVPELDRLPQTRQEAEAIVALAPPGKSRVALDFAANRAAALDAGLGRVRILHFATHTSIHEEFPELSQIVLSRFDEDGRPIEGSVRLHEVYRLPLAADLVVLSSCESARGPFIRGDGLRSFAHAFLTAGASRLLVSLWPVDDAATAELMRVFYRGLFKEGLPAGEALRRAQLAVRATPRWSEPRHWAAFVLQGEVR